MSEPNTTPAPRAAGHTLPKYRLCRRNGYIDLWRFLASCAICLYHGERLFINDPATTNTFQYSGYIFVDFFFLLSGYYAMQHIMKYADTLAPADCGLHAGQYVWHKYKRIYPYVFVCVPATWHILMQVSDYSKLDRLKTILYMPFEMLLFDRTGAFVNHTEATPQMWYLSAMLFTLPLLMYLGLRWKGLFSGVIVWFLPPLLYGYLLAKFNSTISSSANEPVFLRAMAGMLAGCCVWLLSERMRTWRPTLLLRLVLFAVEVPVTLFIVYLGDLHADLGEYSYLVVALFMVMLTLCFSGITPTGHIHSHVLSFLGRLSLPMYLCHFIFRIALFNTGKCLEYSYNDVVALYMKQILLCSAVLLLALDYALPFIWKYARRLFFKPDVQPETPAAQPAPADQPHL